MLKVTAVLLSANTAFAAECADGTSANKCMATDCPSGAEHDACLENGQPDNDCCAMKGQSSCKPGFEHVPCGNKCHWIGAYTTCCVPEGTENAQIGKCPQQNQEMSARASGTADWDALAAWFEAMGTSGASEVGVMGGVVASVLMAVMF